MTTGQELIEAAKGLLDVIAEPNEIVYDMLIDNAVQRLDNAIKAAESEIEATKARGE